MKKLASQIEKDFEALEKQIKNKVKAAAKLLDEAQGLAQKQHHNLSEMYNAYGPLYAAMDNAGWRTSSFGC